MTIFRGKRGNTHNTMVEHFRTTVKCYSIPFVVIKHLPEHFLYVVENIWLPQRHTSKQKSAGAACG